MSKGKTISEPVAVPAEPGEANVTRLRMDTAKYDYVKVEPRPRNWEGAWSGPGDYRKKGYREVTIQNRDDTEVELLYPNRTVYDFRGNPIKVPGETEILHPGYVLMAREKKIGDREREAEERRNNPDLVDPSEVDRAQLYGRDGVEVRERKSVRLSNLEEHLPEEAEVEREMARREKAMERAKGKDPAIEDKIVRAAMEDDKLAD